MFGTDGSGTPSEAKAQGLLVRALLFILFFLFSFSTLQLVKNLLRTITQTKNILPSTRDFGTYPICKRQRLRQDYMYTSLQFCSHAQNAFWLII